MTHPTEDRDGHSMSPKRKERFVKCLKVASTLYLDFADMSWTMDPITRGLQLQVIESDFKSFREMCRMTRWDVD